MVMKAIGRIMKFPHPFFMDIRKEARMAAKRYAPSMLANKTHPTFRNKASASEPTMLRIKINGINCRALIC
jgi:hypothetical protein